jgi:hypothetical protein
LHRGGARRPSKGSTRCDDAVDDGNLLLPALCQGPFLTNNVTFIAINGLVGLSLAPVGWMGAITVALLLLALREAARRRACAAS